MHDPIGADSPEDREAAEAARAEAQRRERRKVITLNKLGAAAEEVRRRFVKRLLARKTAPKGSAQFTAKCLAWSPSLPADYKGLQIVNAMLGLAGDTLRQAVEDLREGSDARAEVILLGIVLAALETRTTKEAWRDATSAYAQWGPPDYLRWLASQGYELGPTDQIVVGDKTADEVFDAHDKRR